MHFHKPSDRYQQYRYPATTGKTELQSGCAVRKNGGNSLRSRLARHMANAGGSFHRIGKVLALEP